MHLRLRSRFAELVISSRSGWWRVVSWALFGIGFVLLSVSVSSAWGWDLAQPQQWEWNHAGDTGPLSEAWGGYTGTSASAACAAFKSYYDGSHSPYTLSCTFSNDDVGVKSFGYAGSNGGTGTVIGNFTGSCPPDSGVGYFPSQGYVCIPSACSSAMGQQVYFKKTYPGSQTCGGGEVCLSGCRGVVVSADCFAIGTSGGSTFTAFYEGYAQVTNTPCNEGDSPANFTGLALPGDVSPVSPGGRGISVDNESTDASSINLAKIATNTANMAAALAAGGGGTGGGSCGGDGQPPCAIEAGDTEAAQASSQAAILASRDSMQGAVDGVAGSLASPPSFLPGTGAWIPSFTSVLPSAACSISRTLALPVLGNVLVDFSICQVGPYGRDILGFVLYLTTLGFVFWTLFRRGA